jgi:uncharacterized protein with HEPN domain
MPRRHDEATVQQIVDAADKMVRRFQSLSYNQFVKDEEKRDALVRPLEIMGESVSRVSVAFRTANPDLMPWSTVKAMRNLLIHGYDTVDLDEVWTMVTHDVPTLSHKLRTWLETHAHCTEDPTDSHD